MNTQPNRYREADSDVLMTDAELMLINQERIFVLNLEKINKTLQDKRSMKKMSRYAQNKMREDFERATSMLLKIKLIKEKYNSPCDGFRSTTDGV